MWEITFLFHRYDVKSIYVDDYAFSFGKGCRRCHTTAEGLFKEFISFVKNPDGTPHYENTYQYAILRKEWK